MLKTDAGTGWRAARRKSARDAIVDAAWDLVRSEGLAALSLRDLAARAGITTPTVYAYFDSKNAIYDAMFGRAAAAFADRMTEPYEATLPRDLVVSSVRRFVDFCTSDVARYQLLFQRTIPGFEPSPESFAPSVRALEATRERLATNGITEQRHVDMFTAIVTGLVDQQISNDPGGTRWVVLLEEVVDMYLRHCTSTNASAAPRRTRGRRASSETTGA